MTVRAGIDRPPPFEIFRTATFRLTLGFAGILTGTLLLAFVLIYWQITGYELMRADSVLSREAAVLSNLPRAELIEQIRFHKNEDLRLVIAAAALFDARHHYISGNLDVWPQALRMDGTVRLLALQPLGQEMRMVRAVAAPLPDGTVLVLARGIRDLEELRAIVIRALELCAVPAVVLSLIGGSWLSHRALRRVDLMRESLDRIMAGDLHERLPAGGGHDEMQRLAASVNRMLERLAHLVDEIKGVGDDIAHDLRTPLTRVRALLDRARSAPRDADALHATIERAIVELDQCFTIITALLRIGEIENGRRRAGFGIVDLGAVAADIVDLYEPIAETKGVALRLVPPVRPAPVLGDRDLLIEAAANLIDNALKFTPEGGQVTIGVETAREGQETTTLRVADDGPGIAPAEREAVLGRFYRSDKSRHVPGSGLGLSLVAAIVRLHEATITVEDARPGALFLVRFPMLVAGPNAERAGS